MPPQQAARLDAAGCDALARALGDTPETVIAVHQLQRRLCSAYAVGDPGRPDAAVVRPTLLVDEPMAFGTDAGALWRALADLSGWTCVNVDEQVAPRLGRVIEARRGRPVRYLGDVYHTLDRPADPVAHPTVRSLTPDDVGLLAAAPADVRETALGFGSFEGLLDEGIAAGAVVDGGLVALAWTTAQSVRHADLGVVTAGAWRGQGLATACAALVCEGVRGAGRVPVWSAGKENAASLRIARKLGFRAVGRRTYVVPDGGGTDSR